MEQKGIALTILGIVAIISIVGLVLLFTGGATGRLAISPYKQASYVGVKPKVTTTQCGPGETWYKDWKEVKVLYGALPGADPNNDCYQLASGGFCCQICPDGYSYSDSPVSQSCKKHPKLSGYCCPVII